MNKFDKRVALLPEKISESLKQEIVATVPFDDKIVLQSINTGVPFMVDNKTQIIGKAIYQLVEVIKDKLKKLENAEVEKAVGKF
jgi:MinD-like ATPase involved in chromosome partitioning or flagellar assembly